MSAHVLIRFIKQIEEKGSNVRSSILSFFAMSLIHSIIQEHE